MRARSGVLALLVLLSVITYMDRVCIAFAGGDIQRDLAIAPEHWGWVLSIFAVSYGLFEIPSGALGDRYGQRRVLARIVCWWSAFTVLTGMASSYAVLLVTRFFFGMGEAGAYPNASGCVRRWFPATERARAQGYIWGASRVGGAITPLLAAPLIGWLGWRAAFYLFGAIGLAWAGVWYAWYRDRPAEHPAVTPAELDQIGDAAISSDHAATPWTRLFANPQLWLLMGMYWCYVWGSMFFLTWFPEYLMQGRGLSGSGYWGAAFTSLPFVMGAIGNYVGGQASDRLARRRGLWTGRVLVGSACLAIAGLLLIAAALVPGRLSAVVLLSVAFGVMDGMLPCAWAICLDIGGKHAGAVSGAMNSAGQAGGFACATLYGYLLRWYGNYNVPLVVIGLMVLVSAGLFGLLDPNRPLLAKGTAPVAMEEPCVLE